MIHYVTGNATRPIGDGPRIIAHVCNDIGAWGRGFVVAVSERWPEPERGYREWHAGKPEQPFELGQTQFVRVEPNLWVANMIGQHDIHRARSPQPVPPIRYEAIEQALVRVAAFAKERGATVHMPRIGCGLAGGTWDQVEPILRRTLGDARIETFVYDL